MDTLSRLAVIAEHILPAYEQLDEKAPATLVWRSDVEVERLNGTLSERVGMCACLLECYERLGQTPPPHFRQWKAERVRARVDNVTAKEPLLRQFVALNAQLGQPRMDWNVPAWSEEAIRQRCKQLEEQVSASRLRREKDELIGKAEAAYWLKKEEPPFGLATMSNDELRQHIKDMRSGKSSRGKTHNGETEVS